MNKLMTTLAAIALSFGAFASITTIPLNPGTLSSGYLSEAVSNKFLLGGTDLVVDGTAFTGGNAYLILER